MAARKAKAGGTRHTIATRNKGSDRLVERAIEGPDGKTHRLLVNLGESPVSWLHARKMLSRRQLEAAEVIRADWERAALGARVTMNWESAAAPSRQSRGAPRLVDPTTKQIAARDRVLGALDAAGPGLSDILWRVVCACEGLAAAEHALGWPIRAGKLVLGFALDRVADFYRLK
jgi:hypothetical protein